jgi:protein-S-isoprenylcysteine O-methyltransferase Ste14
MDNSRLASSLWLGARSLLWIVLLPGMVAGYVPWRFFRLGSVQPDFGNPTQLLGLLGVGAGAALLGMSVWEFASSGRGTLSPVDPPQELVVRGLYRYVRNPMYLGVTTILLGEALLGRSRGLLIYWAAWFALANLFVMLYEEPALRRRFGPSYDEYARRVSRWLPLVRRS